MLMNGLSQPYVCYAKRAMSVLLLGATLVVFSHQADAKQVGGIVGGKVTKGEAIEELVMNALGESDNTFIDSALFGGVEEPVFMTAQEKKESDDRKAARAEEKAKKEKVENFGIFMKKMDALLKHG
jgi:hypothetical protein